MKNDIDLVDAKRNPINHAEMIKLMGWSWGNEGIVAARIWQGLNEKHFNNTLTPLPIWFPATLPWGSAIGLFAANLQGESLHIQIKRGLSLQHKADVIFHEMIHQSLSESDQDTSHNALPWCDEIMRLATEIWNVSIWASPSVPRKVDGKSKRIQKHCPIGKESIPRTAIAGFPDSLNLHIPINDYL